MKRFLSLLLLLFRDAMSPQSPLPRMCRLLADLRPPLISRRFPPLPRLLPAATPRPPVFRLIPPWASMRSLASMGRPAFTPLPPPVPRRFSLPVPLRIPFSVPPPVPRLRPRRWCDAGASLLPPAADRAAGILAGVSDGFRTLGAYGVSFEVRSDEYVTRGRYAVEGKVITSCWAMPRSTATEPCATRWTKPPSRGDDRRGRHRQPQYPQ